MYPFKAGWRVIYTKPRHEKKVAEQLQKLEIGTFLPIIKDLRKWGDRNKYIDSPLFPSYIFVHLRNNQHYYKSLSIDGVLCYVRIGKEIAGISQATVDDIRLIVDNGKEIEVSTESLQPGRRLLIKEGPFTGFSCEVIEHKGEHKIRVRIALLQRSILLKLPREYLMTASAAIAY